MTAMKWHADDALLAAYTDGSLDAIAGASVEQHLAHCSDCRTAIRSHTDLPGLDLAWDQVRRRVEQPLLPGPVRLAQRLGLGEPTSILLAATASMRTAWLVSALVALGFATVAAALAGGLMLAPFLLVAPLIPVLGVATTFGPHEDPLEALIVTSPYGRVRLILVRTLAVLVTTLPAAVLLGLGLPGPLWVAGAWLGPALTLIPILLALSSYVGPNVAAALVSIGWSGVVLLSVRTLGPTWPVEAPVQLTCLALALAACLVLGVRGRFIDRIGVQL
jgi:hypothetical protein